MYMQDFHYDIFDIDQIMLLYFFTIVNILLMVKITKL